MKPSGCKQMINIKMIYKYLISILETILLCANEWLILNRIIIVGLQYLKPFRIISISNTWNDITVYKQMGSCLFKIMLRTNYSLSVYIYIYISCHAISTDIPDPLLPHLPIVHCFRQILRDTSRIGTELLYIGSNWTFCLCSPMWRGRQEYIPHVLVRTSPAVSCVSSSSSFDSFRDGW